MVSLARNKILLVGVLLLTSSAAMAVQLENWRFPYYNFASRLGCYSSSQSGMFWDDLGPMPDSVRFLDKSLWPDSGRSAQNHWILEPAVTGAFGNENAYFGKNSAFAATLLNDIRYKSFLTRQVIDVDSRFGNDPQYPWLFDRGVAARISEAYLQYSFNYGFFRVGRLDRNWGPFADRSLILSNNPYSYDGVEFGLHSPFFEFRHFFAAFPDNGMALDLDSTGVHRYLTAHSLNFLLGRFGTVGITETVVFGRSTGIPDLQYVNPLSVYFVTNCNGEGDGNLMEAFQWNLHPFVDNVSIKGQLLIDDFQVDSKGPGNDKPNTWGTDLGVFWSRFLPTELFSRTFTGISFPVPLGIYRFGRQHRRRPTLHLSRQKPRISERRRRQSEPVIHYCREEFLAIAGRDQLQTPGTRYCSVSVARRQPGAG